MVKSTCKAEVVNHIIMMIESMVQLVLVESVLDIKHYNLII